MKTAHLPGTATHAALVPLRIAANAGQIRHTGPPLQTNTSARGRPSAPPPGPSKTPAPAAAPGAP
eukprot:7138343-Lingulodinium_polyedra.AAC.1